MGDVAAMPRPRKIRSGGQAGVDRAALDFALERGIMIDGWVPSDWASEDGYLLRDRDAIPRRYIGLRACRGGYVERTHRNILSSTATLIVLADNRRPSPGSAMTIDYASKIGTDRRCVYEFRLIVMLDNGGHGATALESIRAWAQRADLSDLNIAGPRESKAPGIYAATLDLLREAWP